MESVRKHCDCVKQCPRPRGSVPNPDMLYGTAYTFITYARVAGVRLPSVCMCLSVCPHDRTKTAETAITKLETCHRYSSPRVLDTHLILGQKVKGQGHRVTRCKTYFMRSSAQRICLRPQRFCYV